MPASRRRLPAQIGRYRVLKELGRGAMGRVLLCEDPVLGREVALKHLRTDLAIAPEQRDPLLKRMRQEARASARVSHPNLVALHDMGEDPVVALFLVFEYVRGPTLKERIAEGRLSSAATARLARELGSGMHFAHLAGVLHRDIKPENVMLSPSGAKLADFGIARVPDSTLTQGGSILGTPAYSAPEAVGDGKFSPQSDQFSLAATLYEALSGQRAFPGDDAVSVATLIATRTPAPIALACGVAQSVDRVLMRAMAKQPNARFPDCAQFGEALASALGSTVRSQQVTLPDNRREDLAREASRWPSLVGGAVLGAVGMWAGAQWLNGFVTPVHSSIVAEVEPAEAAPVAWLAERPAKTTPQEKKDPSQRLRPALPAASGRPKLAPVSGSPPAPGKDAQPRVEEPTNSPESVSDQ